MDRHGVLHDLLGHAGQFAVRDLLIPAAAAEAEFTAATSGQRLARRARPRCKGVTCGALFDVALALAVTLAATGPGEPDDIVHHRDGLDLCDAQDGSHRGCPAARAELEKPPALGSRG